ncbi:MAG: hypothetical protein J6D27_02730 [Ruminiclostridium sp.]|nr:hypothetical protein [Ruminiclostridium sp.]
MSEFNRTNEVDEIDNNDDMIAKEENIDNTVSFKVNESAAPQRGWTKKQIRSVWIIGVIAAILIAVCSFLLRDVNIFGIFS